MNRIVAVSHSGYSEPVEILGYSDGGCSGNPGPGGWAYILVIDGTQKKLSGGEANTTNNRMELTAVLNGLKDINSHPEWRKAAVVFHTDSQYVQKGITQWIHTWVRNGWLTSGKKPVKNRDLWIALKDVSDLLDVDWRWVRGHSGDSLNELCDAMVQAEIAKISP
jgi:ribonuclease HI